MCRNSLVYFSVRVWPQHSPVIYRYQLDPNSVLNSIMTPLCPTLLLTFVSTSPVNPLPAIHIHNHTYTPPVGAYTFC